MRKRRIDLGMSMNALDERSGLQCGYAAKLEMKTNGTSARGLGRVSLPLWLGGLKVGIVLVDLTGEKGKGLAA